MISDRSRVIGQKFSRSAISYDAHAQVQRIMADQLTKSLVKWSSQALVETPAILEIGCGTGTLTQIVMNKWHEAKITAVDLASEMIKVAKERVLSTDNQCASTETLDTVCVNQNDRAERVDFIQADIETWVVDAPTSSFDIIISSACFQWLSNPLGTLVHLHRLLKPNGLLLFTTFGPDTFCEMHYAFNKAYRAYGLEPQRHGLSFLSLAQWEILLMQSGYSSVCYDRTIHVKKYASARDFLHCVKAMGASTSEAIPLGGHNLRNLFTAMYKEYEDTFSTQGGVTATYDLLLVQSETTS
ncbi:malonyl-ACP O-methyltransferase BioC [Paenibacillus sp. L3-i20]|uniref:malonyl-ACP O-methyltransferase BioC n=1 Tax=Paenibacillus sp. L3-i20 TaxID=2905833 RepID=UPI001EE00A00|nr:malonyl-ACP O-methyltransferase BioC [Paenibacillus sp. L3-i20]GKU77410.1 malonyl-[acyl-carrier protein] O-methyltransferase [Paenibacillus sp. L3-i20]